MENGTNKLPVNEKEIKRSKPNWVSWLFICWMCPVLVNGNRRPVEEEDLIVPSKKFDSERLGLYLERYWLEEVEKAAQQGRPPSLRKAMIRGYWLAFMPAGFLLLICTALRTLQPLLFSELLMYWSVDSKLSKTEASYYALGMIGLGFCAALCQHHTNLSVQLFSLKVKVGCSALLYRKVMRINQVSMGDVAAGKIVNIMANDLNRFDYAFMFLHHVWMVPLQSAIVIYFLYKSAGYAPVAGLVAIVIFLFPAQVTLTKWTTIMRRKTAKRSDTRIKLMSEIVNGIQVIKMYAWEKPFLKVVSTARAKEMAALTKALYIRNTMTGFMQFTERLNIFIATLIITLSGSVVSATVIYPMQQFLHIIQTNLTMLLPFAIVSISEMLVSIERIQSCLITDEREDLAPSHKFDNNKPSTIAFSYKKNLPHKISVASNESHSKTTNAVPTTIGGEFALELNDINANWTGIKDTTELTLKNITLRVRRGKLCAIIGPVGSGKSSLLHVLLKELPINHGSFSLNGTLSYACQESWLFPGTVKENILFGLPYDPQKYKQVCNACALKPDFKQFPYGDLSLVGERGVILSGGQRARINLARAVYRDADIYLLDDPLSAVDANVGRQLFDGCIKGYLRSKTVILVTHQIHFLTGADTIVVINNSTIENIGTYDELHKSGKSFSLLMTEMTEGEDANAKKRTQLQRGISTVSAKSEEESNQKEQTVVAEERSSGRLKISLLLKYLGSVRSWFIILLTLLTIITAQGAATAADYWISFWTNEIDDYAQTLPPGETIDPNLSTQAGALTIGQYLWIYGGIAGFIILMTQVRIIMFVKTSMRASQNLHDVIFSNLIAAVMRFFDLNPSGRVLNRFSKDLGAMDELLPRAMIDVVQIYLRMASILVLNAVALPWTLIPTFCLLVIFTFLSRWYLNTAQQVKRLEGTTKSPVFNMINSTISGISTIRCLNAQSQLIKSFDIAQNAHTSSFFTFLGGTTAFGLYLDMMCLCYLAIIMAIFILIDFSSAIPVGSVGLAVSQSLALTYMLQMAARSTSDFLAQMTAVERIVEYTELPSEKNAEVGTYKTPKDWPQKGNVQFENVYLSYGVDDPAVLKNLNFEIKEGWKVGVVGRTGAGKSSLISALFRLYEVEGTIRIDGVDTTGLSKMDLRSKISIIPQEPVLFSATMRYNLDPFNVYSDEDLWRALEQVELKDAVAGLDFKVSEGGANFSVGQRQLICLARAILRSNKILVMDEATANIDLQTDALIQETIRREFATCTVITIAHRLNTIMDSDHVLVIDKGVVAEFDYPYKLVQNPHSILSSMLKETGDNMIKNFKEVAQAKYYADHPLEKESYLPEL